MEDEEDDRGIELPVVDREILERAGTHIDVLGAGESTARRRQHRARLIDGDDATHEGRERLRDLSGAASDVADRPIVVDQAEEREEIDTPPEHLGAKPVPMACSAGEELLRARAPLRENTLHALRVLRRDSAL